MKVAFSKLSLRKSEARNAGPERGPSVAGYKQPEPTTVLTAAVAFHLHLHEDKTMRAFIATLILTASLVGIASVVHARTCTTNCSSYGGQTSCSTYCY